MTRTTDDQYSQWSQQKVFADIPQDSKPRETAALAKDEDGSRSTAILLREIERLSSNLDRLQLSIERLGDDHPVVSPVHGGGTLPLLQRFKNFLGRWARIVYWHLPDPVAQRVKLLRDRLRMIAKFGWGGRHRELLLPDGLFDEERYLRMNPDIDILVRDGILQDGRKHFLSWGIDELAVGASRTFRVELGGLEFDFDEEAYRVDNPDVSALIAKGRYRSGIDHFLHQGYRECREGLRAIYGPHRFIRQLRQEDGTAPLFSDRRYLVLFAHYDRDGIIDDYVLSYLDALRAAGADICFITPTLAPAELDKVRAQTFRIIVKNDAGRDFGSWYLGLQSIGEEFRQEYKYLLFVNDSIYFPVVDCRSFFSQMQASKFDFWGITDSYQYSYHLQSYFLAFSRAAQQALLPWFAETYRAVPYMTKAGQISTFELGFTKQALESGLSVGAYCAISDIRDDVLRKPGLSWWRQRFFVDLRIMNPSHQAYDLLIQYCNCPALKVELLRDNPLSVDTRRWKTLVDPHSLAPAVVERHLQRMARPGGMPPVAPAAAADSHLDDVVLLDTVEGRGFGTGRRLVLLAHYDPQGIIDPYVETSIRSLHDNDCDVALITPTTRQAEIERMRSLCSAILIKNDRGRDFGSWFLASQALAGEYGRYESIIWMNDSTYFPLFSPDEMFTAMEQKGYDFWGVVDSYNLRWHVMSWFWSFRRELVEGGWPLVHIGQFHPGFSKWDQIRNYEMRLPESLRRAGHKIGAYVVAEDVLTYVSAHERDHERFTGKLDFTMTHDFWDVIVRKFRCPALKVELVRDNPLGMHLGDLFSFVDRNTDYDSNLIRAHLRRIKTEHLATLRDERESSTVQT